jgi:hypothetical protein
MMMVENLLIEISVEIADPSQDPLLKSVIEAETGGSEVNNNCFQRVNLWKN